MARRRKAVIDAAMRLAQRRGFDMTMDEVAEESGLGRRTVFRYFPTRAELLAAVVREAYAEEHREQDLALLGPHNIEQSLRHLFADAVATAEKYGRLAWDLAREEHAHDELAAAAEARRKARATHSKQVVKALWTREGQSGAPPRWLVDAYTLLEGMYTVVGLRVDAGVAHEEIPVVAAHLMRGALREAIDQRGRSACKRLPSR